MKPAHIRNDPPNNNNNNNKNIFSQLLGLKGNIPPLRTARSTFTLPAETATVIDNHSGSSGSDNVTLTGSGKICDQEVKSLSVTAVRQLEVDMNALALSTLQASARHPSRQMEINGSLEHREWG